VAALAAASVTRGAGASPRSSCDSRAARSTSVTSRASARCERGFRPRRCLWRFCHLSQHASLPPFFTEPCGAAAFGPSKSNRTQSPQGNFEIDNRSESTLVSFLVFFYEDAKLGSPGLVWLGNTTKALGPGGLAEIRAEIKINSGSPPAGPPSRVFGIGPRASPRRVFGQAVPPTKRRCTPQACLVRR
jgi:hypothetical protein